MRPLLLSTLVITVLFLDSCSSGKNAYKHGNYFDAVLTAVQRLRHNPDHKKSKEVLGLATSLLSIFLKQMLKIKLLPMPISNGGLSYKTMRI